MSTKIWSTCQDGKIEIKSLTPEYLDGALKVMEKGFFGSEIICSGLKLTEDREALLEALELCKIVALDGISLVAVQKSSNRVVGAVINKLRVPPNGTKSNLEIFAETCKHDTMQWIMMFLKEMDDACNLFEFLNVDCLMEIAFAAVLPEFTKTGIGIQGMLSSMQLAKELAKGNNIRQSLNGEILNLEKRPKAIMSVCTSPHVRKIGRKFGWNIAKKIDFNKLFYNGRSIYELTGDNEAHATIEYLKLC